MVETQAVAGTEESIEILASGSGGRVERIVSRGHFSPPGFWYDQEDPEWVMVVRGCARLEFQDPSSTLELAAGDALLIPARCRHRVAWTDPDRDTIWIAVYLKDGAGPIEREAAGEGRMPGIPGSPPATCPPPDS